MKFKNIKILFTLALFVLSIGVFSACGAEKRVSFSQDSLVLSINEEYDLKEIVKLENCNLGDITFVSNEPNVVYVTPSYKLVTRTVGNAIITAEGFADATLEVTVNGIANMKFNAPTNIAYDEASNRIVWDAVYAGDIIATTYNLEIYKNDVKLNTEPINTNHFEVFESGDYKVKIACEGRMGIDGSEFSKEYKFSKLSAPSNLEYNEQTGLLTWDADDTAKNFRVFVNGVSSKVLTEKKYALDLSAEKQYEIFVMTCAGEEGENVFGATSTKRLSLKRLKAPNIEVNDGSIYWNGEEGVSKYKVIVPGVSEPVIIAKNAIGNYRYTLPGMSVGTNDVTIFALGDSEDKIFNSEEHYLDSASSSKTIEKLQALELAFIKQSKKLAVKNYQPSSQLKVLLNVEYAGENLGTTLIENIEADGTFSYDFEQKSGEYKFTLINGAKNSSTQVNSDLSNEVTVVKLSSPTSIKHEFVTNNEKQLYNVFDYQILEDDGSVNYTIEVVAPDSSVTILSASNNEVNALFNTVGKYNVSVHASKDDDIKNDVYYIDGNKNTELSVVRLNGVELAKMAEETKILYSELPISNGVASITYSYELYEIGGKETLVKGGVLSGREFNYSDLPAGNYRIKVWASGTSNYNQVKVLSSLTKAQEDFNVTVQLTAPELVWKVEEGNYFIEIPYVEHANRYEFVCNDISVGGVDVEDGQVIKHNVTSCFDVDGVGTNLNEYNFKVIAIKTDDVNYLDSNESTIKIIRAVSPTKFNLKVDANLNESISSEISADWYNGTEILINNKAVENNIFAKDVDQFNVKIKYLANTNNVDGAYYVDSKYTEFSFERMQATLQASGSVVSWNGEQTQQPFTKKLVINDTVEVPANLINLGSINITNVLAFISNDMDDANITYKCIANGLNNADASGTYYLTSNTASLQVSKAGSQNIGLAISETAGNVKISWAEKQEATYKLNGEDVENGESLIPSENITNTLSTFSLQEDINEKTTVYMFMITRVANVNSIEIDKQETIKCNGALPTGVASLVCTIDNVEVTSLVGVDVGGKQVNAYFKAIESEKFNYYLNSETSSFSFKRLGKLNNYTVLNNSIVWTKEDITTNRFEYEVIFSNENGETISVERNDIDPISVNLLTDPTVKDFIYNQNTGKKYFRVRKLAVMPFEAEAGNEYVLSALDDEINNVELKILSAPTGLKVRSVDEDNAQNNLIIEWDSYLLPDGYSKGQFVITVSGPKNETLKVDGHYTLPEASEILRKPGEWKLSIMVDGAEDTISSPTSQEITIERFNKVSNLSILGDGTLKWNAIPNAKGYILEYSYMEEGGEFKKTVTSADGKFDEENGTITYSVIKDEELSKLFEGEINVSVYALGTGTSTTPDATLSSLTETTFNRLASVKATFTNTYIKIDNFADYSRNDIINLDIIINGEVAKTETIKSATWYYPSTFNAKDGTPIDTSVANVIGFKLYATSSSPNIVNSNISQKQVTKLASITNLRFVREDGFIVFKADNANNVGGTPVGKTVITFTVNTEEIEITDSSIGNYKLVINDDTLAKISNDWVFTAYAQGIVDGEIYIDGVVTQIKGTKLQTTSSLYVDNDYAKILWNKVNEASGYDLRIDYLSDNDDTKAIIRKGNLEHDMASYDAGEYNIAVRAIGNVGDAEIYKDIKLDGIYSEDVKFTKLAKIQNVSVQNGYFVMDPVSAVNQNGDNVYKVIAVLSNTLTSVGEEYELYPYTLPEGFGTANYYYNKDIEAKLKEGGEYYVRFYAKAIENNYLSSKFADIVALSGTENYIKVKLFDKVDNSVSLNFKADESGKINYAITYASFKVSSLVSNGIILNVDNDIFPTTDLEYILDSEKDTQNAWSAGEHAISYAQIGSSAIGDDRLVYLTSFGNKTTVTKLQKATIKPDLKEIQAGIFENALTFTNVANATDYYCYINNNIHGIYVNGQNVIDVGNLPAGDYETVKLRAISKDVNYLASDLYLMQDDMGVAIPIKKLPTPIEKSGNSGFMVVDGSFGFVPTLSDIINLYSDEVSEKPFYTSMTKIQNQYFEFRFVNKSNGKVETFIDNAYKYFYITDELIAQVESTPFISEYADQLRAIQQRGFPTLNYSFLDMAQALSFGEYEISARLLGVYDGSAILEFTSEYSKPITSYISNSPNIRIENNNHAYNLKFENVIVNSNYFANPPVYKLIALSAVEGKTVREVIRLGGEDSNPTYGISAKSLNDANETVTINLTELIEKGYLTSAHTKLFVYVEGNDTNLLNGRHSNLIEIKVLEDVVAEVERGVIKWNAQENAVKYIVTYNGQNSGTRKEVVHEDGISIYEWACEELVQNIEYSLTLQAYGTTGTTASLGGIVILSGPVTNMGKIIKLNTIITDLKDADKDLKIDRGIYTWKGQANATIYDVFTDTLETYEEVLSPAYETTVQGMEKHNYYFRAVGTEKQPLNKDTLVYVNSDISNATAGKRAENVTDLMFKDGILTWKSSVLAVYFKLIFTKAGAEDVIINVSYGQSIQVQDDVCVLDTNNYPELRADGDYTVKVQTYYGSTSGQNWEIETDLSSNIYYLISEPTTLEFHKFKNVENIVVDKGVISWNYFGKTDSNFHFRLNFSYMSEVGLVELDKYVAGIAGQTEYSFSEIVFENDIGKTPITLTIYVEPGEYTEGKPTSTDPLAKSIETVYVDSSVEDDVLNGKTNIYQYAKVDNNLIQIGLTGNGQLKIDWPDSGEEGISDCEYEIMFYTSEDPSVKYITVNVSEIICGEGGLLNFNIEGAYSLNFKIRVIPTVKNYISSAWSDEKQIQKPNKVEGLAYNEETYTYTWNKYQIASGLESSLRYKIKDEIGTYEGGEFVVQEVRVYEAGIGDETFTPSIIGGHRVSVAIYVTGSGNALVSDYSDYIISTYDIFASGDGTQDNPYEITNAEQFVNINLRLVKDGKNNSYYESVNQAGEFIINETMTSVNANDTVYHFRLMNNIQITNAQIIVGSFVGNFNGNHYTLTLNLVDESGKTYITQDTSIFESVGKGGTIKNLSVKMLTANVVSVTQAVTIALIANENKGTIQNVVIGKKESYEQDYKTITIETSNTIRVAFATRTNNGVIENVKNYYNVSITGNQTAAINYGSIAINNNSVLNNVKNYGSIVISARTIRVGGVVQFMEGGASITNSANAGRIQAFISSKTTVSSIIGGLVGQQDSTSKAFYNCYVNADITVYSGYQESLNAAIVGGMVGSSNGDIVMKNSYVNITVNNNIPSGNTGSSNIYALIGKVSGNTSNPTNVYHNINGSEGILNPINSLESYTNLYSGTLDVESLGEGQSSFINVQDSTPALVWESEFDSRNAWNEVELVIPE